MSADHDSQKNLRYVPPLCPVGKFDCTITVQVAELRQRLDDLGELVRTDPLTGLANYRRFVEALEHELERTQRSGMPTSLIMLDIDHFKKVNDQWGHETGNRALSHLAQILSQTVRRLDIPCRYGGEEFAIILPDTTLSASVPVAERVRQAIETTPLYVDERELSMTVSLGISTYNHNQESTFEDLVKQADHHLYKAKEGGRNRVCHPPVPLIDVVSAEERKTLTDVFGSGSDKKEDP